MLALLCNTHVMSDLSFKVSPFKKPQRGNLFICVPTLSAVLYILTQFCSLGFTFNLICLISFLIGNGEAYNIKIAPT